MFTKRFIIAFALYALSLDKTSAKPFIDGLKPCKRSDPKLEECLLNILKQAKPQLIRGNPQFNLPPLDPVHIPRISIGRSMQDINVTGDLFNLIANGTKSVTAKAFKVNLIKHTWDIELEIPLIMFITDFDLNVTLKALPKPIVDEGQCTGKISNSVLRLHSDTDSSDDKIKLKSVKINLNLGDVEINIIKSQNPALAQFLSKILKRNKRMVLDLVTPIVEDSAEKLLLRHGNSILSTMQITDLLAD
ncbi:uncharacterized protein LOC112682050 [Sipha flava]|uniref:Uncharacterized protein LOC112682050 n=1 Tax=Sipha flava TaxID=143950 RepID=A0A2S2Q5J5_9HEMI|nr:uncharacterized protein LOC112682050 [Sipha flava]